MKPSSPVIPGSHISEVVYAKDQSQYIPLPALRTPDGIVLSRWELSEEEKKKILETGSVWLMVWTFNEPIQPVSLSVEVPGTFGFAEPRCKHCGWRILMSEPACSRCGHSTGTREMAKGEDE